MRQSALAYAALSAPLVIALYWLLFSSPWLWLVVAVHAVTLIVVGLLLRRLHRLCVQVSGDGLVVHRLIGAPEQVPRNMIGRAIRVEMLSADARDRVPQLYVTALDGLRLLRMNGAFWPQQEMDRLVDGLDLTVTDVGEPTTMPDLAATHPRLVRWWERTVPTLT